MTCKNNFLIENVKIDEIKINNSNPKLHTPEQLEDIKKSIQKFGYNDPIALDQNNTIIEGEGRYLVLRELGWKTVEILRLNHLSEADKELYIIAHNKITLETGFDVEKLKLIFNNLKNEMDILVTGFKQKEIDKIFADIKVPTINDFIGANQELDLNDKKYTLKCKCPKCGFEFNPEEE